HKKGMMGWDMRKGMEAAEGKYLCVIDGDGQFPIESIELCFRLIKEKNLDFVKTYREKREDGIYRIILSDVYNFVFGILFPNLNCKDANSKPKIITSEAYKKMTLSSDDWFLDAEIIINVRKLKLKFEEIPIHFSKIYSRESFVKFNAIFEFIKNLIRFRIKEFF
ncbi:hypothetical protein KA977_04150, partial [Candidatus Dependentiae bacterium]|nr:hypothetical protein [Candidatus Dependentiae bacterium]